MDQLTKQYGNRPLWQWILLYAVIALIAYGLVYYFFFAGNGGYGGFMENREESTNSVDQAVMSNSNTPAPSAAANTPTTPPVGSKLTYDQARAMSIYRFQFDNNCNGGTSITNFGELNAKQGSNIMLENHGDASHVLALGNDKHTVAAGGFVVVTAPKVTKTTGLYITCDGGGAGNLFVNP